MTCPIVLSCSRFSSEIPTRSVFGSPNAPICRSVCLSQSELAVWIRLLSIELIAGAMAQYAVSALD